MSEATTGSAQANARVSTMPKLSPPSDGATSAFVRAKQVGELLLRQEAEDVDPVVGDAQPREQEPDGERIGAADLQAARRFARRISGQARSSTCSPLRGSCRPAKMTVCSRPPGSASSGISTPFGTIS